MKITGFSPAILTPNAKEVVDLFEELGFKTRHNDQTKEGIANDSFRLKDDNGFCVDVTNSEHILKDLTLLHINVDDFDEGYKFFLDHGFKNALGKDVIINAEHWKGAHLASPTGFELMLMQHIHKN